MRVTLQFLKLWSYAQMRFGIFVTAAGSFAESTPYVCFCSPASSEFDDMLPVIHLLIRFISSFGLSSFSVLHSQIH